MLTLTIRPKQNVKITGPDSQPIYINNPGTKAIKVSINAPLEYKIIRSDAKVKCEWQYREPENRQLLYTNRL